MAGIDEREVERKLSSDCRCPHAKVIHGVTPMDAGVVCGVMEADQARADPILEGSPVGVLLKLREDPSIVLGFCLGDEPPAQEPDELRGERIPRHHTCCPIFAADAELAEGMKRLFAPRNREGLLGLDPTTGEPLTYEEEITPEERDWLTNPVAPELAR